MKKYNLPAESKIEEFQTLISVIDAIYIEMKEFSKKKPDEILNLFKVKNVNRVLIEIKDFLTDEPTAKFIDILDEDALPSNSDAILIISQIKSSMDRFKKKYTNKFGKWTTKENPEGSII